MRPDARARSRPARSDARPGYFAAVVNELSEYRQIPPIIVHMRTYTVRTVVIPPSPGLPPPLSMLHDVVNGETEQPLQISPELIRSFAPGVEPTYR